MQVAADEAGALLEQFLPHLVDQQQAAEALLRQMREVFDAGVFAEQLQEMEEMVGGLGEGQPKGERAVDTCLADAVLLVERDGGGAQAGGNGALWPSVVCHRSSH